MNIPDKAVEAAAKARASGYGSYPAPAKRSIREEVRPILEAAAPFIAAQALREHVAALTDAGDKGCQDEYVGLYEAASLTKARADDLEANK